jgi:hypothetical protein
VVWRLQRAGPAWPVDGRDGAGAANVGDGESSGLCLISKYVKPKKSGVHTVSGAAAVQHCCRMVGGRREIGSVRMLFLAGTRHTGWVQWLKCNGCNVQGVVTLLDGDGG